MAPDTAATVGVRIEPDAEFPDMLRAYSNEPYFGITHGVWFGQAPRRSVRGRLHNALLWLWRKARCGRGIHAWDEVTSGEHYLSCDACDLILHIRDIEVTHVDGLGMD